MAASTVKVNWDQASRLADGTRVYPGKGREVSLSDLGPTVRWIGDNVGLGDGLGRVDVLDLAGNWASTSVDKLKGSPVWARLDEYSRSRIEAATRSERVVFSKGGPKAYAMLIQGDELAPYVLDGHHAVFDPDAGHALKDEIAAVWFHGESKPFVVRLALAVPPCADFGPDLEPILVVRTNEGIKAVAMSRIRCVDRFVGAAEGADHV
jgi:hypothetical protein